MTTQINPETGDTEIIAIVMNDASQCLMRATLGECDVFAEQWSREQSAVAWVLWEDLKDYKQYRSYYCGALSSDSTMDD